MIARELCSDRRGKTAGKAERQPAVRLLLTHDLYDHSLIALAIEFGVEDPLPGP